MEEALSRIVPNPNRRLIYQFAMDRQLIGEKLDARDIQFEIVSGGSGEAQKERPQPIAGEERD